MKNCLYQTVGYLVLFFLLSANIYAEESENSLLIGAFDHTIKYTKFQGVCDKYGGVKRINYTVASQSIIIMHGECHNGTALIPYQINYMSSLTLVCQIDYDGVTHVSINGLEKRTNYIVDLDVNCFKNK